MQIQKKENSLNFLGDSSKSFTPSPILLAKYNIIQMGNKIELAWVKSNLDSTGDLRMNWIKNRQRLKCTGLEIKRLKDSTNIIWKIFLSGSLMSSGSPNVCPSICLAKTCLVRVLKSSTFSLKPVSGLFKLS